MKRRTHIISLIAMAVAFMIAANTDVPAQLLSEIEIDPPSAISDACQFTEIRGVPGSVVQANTYFLSVNSDGGNFGFANQAVNFGGQTVGANGTITLFNTSFGECPNRTYGTGTARFNYFSPLRVGTGSETYLIVRSTSVLFSGQDLDTNDDGVFDVALGITVLDGFALIVNPEEEFVYGAASGVVNISNTISLDQPDAVVRFPGDPTPFASSAFFFGELAASPDESVEFAAPFSPNFPAGAVLTPGNGNVPTPTNTVQFSSSVFSNDESQTATITVNRTGDTTGTATVNVSTTNGSATGGAACGMGVDFVNASQVLTFGPGITTRDFTVTLCGDQVVDPSETINLTLTSPVGGGVGSSSTAVLTINDTANQFLNTTPITINQGTIASPYPSNITVAGATGNVFRIRVTLYDYYHQAPDNVDVLLVGPNGAEYVLMGDVGGATPISEDGAVTLTFADFSPTVLPDAGPLVTGSFKPTTCESPVTDFQAPAPAGPYVEPGCTAARPNSQTLFGNFGGQSGNGVWSLYVRDDNGTLSNPAQRPEVVLGEISGGWGLELLPSTAAGVEVSGRVLTPDGRGLRNARVTITDSNGINRTATTSSFGHYKFEDVEIGSTFVMGVSSQRYRYTSRVVQVFNTLADIDFVGQE